MATGHGRADYLLYVDQQAVGVIEAKPEGTAPVAGWSGSRRCTPTGLPAEQARRDGGGTAGCRSCSRPAGSETALHQRLRPGPARPANLRLPRPDDPGADRCGRPTTTRQRRPGGPRCAGMPPLDATGLRPAQIDAIDGLERSLAEQRPRPALVQMATGAGKTFTAVTASLPAAQARRRPTGSCSWSTATTSASRRCAEFAELPDPGRRAASSPSSTTSTSSPARACSDSSSGRRSPRSSASTRRLRGEELDPTWTTTRAWTTAVPDAPVDGRLQPGHPAGDVRPGHRRRVPPLDLRPVARRARVLRRARHRPDRDAGQADVRVLPAEPGLGVHLRAGGRRRGQRRLRRLPDQDPDHRAGLDDRGRHGRADARPPHPRRSATRSSTRTSSYTQQPARPRGDRDATRSAWCWRRSATGCSPRSSRAASTVPKTLIFAKDDAHAEEIVTDGPRGVRQGQRLRREDHLQPPQRRPDELLAGVPQQRRACGSRSPST